MILIFDLGATHFRYSLCDGKTIGEAVRGDTDTSAEGFERWLEVMKLAVGKQPLEAVVGGMAGQIEGADGELKRSPNLPKWEGLLIRKRMQEVFECPVYIMNDVVVDGLGEAYDGAGITRGVMAYFTVSTGVNAVRLVNGDIDPTIDEYDLGRQLVEQSGEAGNAMTLEQMVGGAATQKRYGREPHDIREPRLWRLDEATLARVAYNTVLYWAPDVIVFGGSMMRDIEVAQVAKYYRKLPQILPDRPKLVAANLGDLAGLHGALHWWLRHKK